MAGLAAAVALLVVGLVSGISLGRRTASPPSAASMAGTTARTGGQVALTPVRFVLVAPRASRVSVVGDFNRWNTAASPMRRSGDGRSWSVEVPLPPGRHVYAFVVDGEVVRDPDAAAAPDDGFGVRNSVLLVADGTT
jgi:1,4-alpha-glucan branching enzyme